MSGLPEFRRFEPFGRESGRFYLPAGNGAMAEEGRARRLPVTRRRPGAPDPPQARWLKQFQEKWTPLFRPELRENKEIKRTVDSLETCDPLGRSGSAGR
jgi:hypothetical protein